MLNIKKCGNYYLIIKGVIKMFIYLVCYIDVFDGDIIDILKVFKTYYDAQSFLELNKRFYSNLSISTIRVE